MGSVKFTYTDYYDNIDYWKGEKGLDLPKWADEIAEKGGKPVCAIDFYDALFAEHLEEHRLPDDYQTGEYAAIALELIQDGTKKHGHRTTITKGNAELHELIDSSENFCMIAPISYAGRRRIIENARYLFALAIEIDDIQPQNGIDELFHGWERNVFPLPKPTYIVCSGNGLHLYYIFERPIPLFANIFQKMSKIKRYFTPLLWNRYVTTSHEAKQIQWESLNQPFRCVGTRGKKPCYAMAFEVGEKITLEYLNKFLPEDLQVKDIYGKGRISLEEAKKMYPDWYQKKIIEKKQAKGHWNRHQPIYFDWIEKIKNGAVVGKRYNCLENLCSLAVQCEIKPEQVEKDCREVAALFEEMTISDDNHFTEYDILCALKTYQQPTEKAYRRRIEFISQKTGIELKRNKRRKKPLKRDDGTAFRAARMMQDLQDPDGEWRNKNGRPTAQQTVRSWREQHPEGKPKDCIEDKNVGLSKNTVYKWWNC